jgi:ribonucleoside-diphosphate reductase alpha chain
MSEERRRQLTADDLELPVKRTDGDTMEERLTANAYHNILPARYLRKDADGNVVEEPEELFARVAKNIALAEAVFEARRRDLEVTVTPDQIKPDHPRRDELAAEVFGAGTTVDDDVETTLTEENVNKFAYDTVVPELPDAVRTAVTDQREEFQELMEELSFTPNCVPPGSMVAAGGGLKQLTDIEPGERVYDDEDGLATVESKFSNGEKTVMEITTDAGYTVQATPEHYFRVISEAGEYEWRQVKDIRERDTLALQKNFLDDDADRPTLEGVDSEPDLGRERGAFTAPRELTPDLAEWLGYYIGDGTARESGVRVAFDSRDTDILDHWSDLTEQTFGFTPTVGEREDASCVVGRASRRDLYAFLDRNDLLKETSSTAVVPEAVLRAGRTCTARFLRGLFEADGTVGDRAIELYTHSDALASQVQTLLLGLGVRAKVSPKQDGYRVTIRKNVCGERFVERVGFASDRKRADSERFTDIATNAGSVKIPNQTERLHEWFKNSDLGHDAYRDLSQFLIDPESEYHQEIGKEIFQQYAEEYPELRDSPVAEFVGRDQFYEPVASVSEVGTMAVEDMQVPRRNTYIVEGFVSHNSPTLMNAGDELQQLSACFVDSPGDDITDIHQTAKEAAEIFQSGGGMGYAFWKLRPYGDPVGSTGGIASGPITFMRTYDQLCETIAQGGARRGAQMGVMRVSHPDVIQFLHAKNKDVSLAHSLRLNDPDDFTHTSFAEALEEARELIDEDGKVPRHLRNAVEGHLSNFNISVGITHDFMEALYNDEEFTFTNPRTEEPHVATPQTKELYEMFGLGEHVEVGEVLSVPAREIWSDIVEGAHENGEPGVIYLDRVNDEHSFDIEKHPDHEILATNPCVTGDTLVSTGSGLVTAEELYEQGVAQDVVVDGRLSEDRVKEASSVYKTGEKDVYKLTTEEGYELRLTADHQVMTTDGWVEAGDLAAGDTVHIQNRKGGFGRHGTAAEGRVAGWLVGDGDLKHGEERAVLNFYDEDSEISEAFAEDVNEVVREPTGNANYEIGVSEISRNDEYRGAQAVEQRIRSTRLYELADELGLVDEKHQVPDAVMRGSEEMARGFLQALFTADGSVQGNVEEGLSVRLASSDRDLLGQVQQLLLNFGVGSRIYENRREVGTRELPDGKGVQKEYDIEAQHELAVASSHLVAFEEEIGFLREDKTETLANRLAEYSRGPYSPKFEATVESVTPDGHETVYDLTEPDTHSFLANGITVHNCGEQPLEEYEACNLGHINLSTLAAEDAPDWRVWYDAHREEYDDVAAAMEAFLEEAIDTAEFDRRIESGTRFLENVVTMSDFPVPEIEEKVSRMRKIGMGIMGLAQLYIQLGIQYGTEPGNELARQLMTHINHGSKRASHDLADQRGSFADWADSKYAAPTEYREWFEHHTGEDADDWADGYPIRNHNTTTIAPTGTTSMVGNTTGGCEPIYNVAYYKNVSDDVQGDEMLVEFDDYFLRVLEANGIDVEAVKREAQEQMADNAFDGVESLSTVPDAISELFVVTSDLSGKQHAAVQCACQEGVDSAISKTCNFPNDSTVEDMDEVYRYIYDHGGKGVTVYRDGTRSKQVLTTRAQNTEFSEMDPDEAAEAIVTQIEEVFGGFEEFLEREDVRELLGEELEGFGEPTVEYADKQPRPDVLRGVTQRIDTGYGKLYVTINEDPEREQPFELFANIGNSGGFTASFTEALAKTISTALRSGVDPDELANELKGIRSPKVAWDKGEQINSIPDAVGTAMRRYLDDEIDKPYPRQQRLSESVDGADEGRAGDVNPNADVGVDADAADEAPKSDGGAAVADDPDAPDAGARAASDPTVGADDGDEADATQDLIDAGESPECPECGALSLYYSEGCKTCQDCGWSEC